MNISICKTAPATPKKKTVAEVPVGHGYTMPSNSQDTFYLKVSNTITIWFHQKLNGIGVASWECSKDLPIQDEFIVDIQLTVKEV